MFNSHKNLIYKISFGTAIILMIFVMPFTSFAIIDVLTGSATGVTDSEAKLSGSANPDGKATYGYFRYSTIKPSPLFCNEIYGSNMKSTNEVYLGAGNGSATFSSKIYGLFPSTTYYFCAVGSPLKETTKEKIEYGGVKSFTTNPNSINPTVIVGTNNALVVNSTSAYLNGFYNSNISNDTWFEYRKKSTSSIGMTWSEKKGNENHKNGGNGKLSFLLTKLSPDTVYEFRTAIKSSTSANITYGLILNFKTKSSGGVTPGEVPNGDEYISLCDVPTDPNCNGSGPNNWTPTDPNINPHNQYDPQKPTSPTNKPFKIGQKITPPIDAVVRYHEGIETVFFRQIIGNAEFAKLYGYKTGTDLNSFAWNLADIFAKVFGYVNYKGKEIRVSLPDVAAYQLSQEGSKLKVYEYLFSTIVNIQSMTPDLRNKYEYEYYFKK